MRPSRSPAQTSAWTAAGRLPKLHLPMRRIAIFLISAALGGCNVIEQPSGLIPRWTTAYKEVISEDDRVRMRDWRQSFTTALDAARKSGHSAEIEREGALLDPDAALPTPAIPNGLYN